MKYAQKLEDGTIVLTLNDNTTIQGVTLAPLDTLPEDELLKLGLYQVQDVQPVLADFEYLTGKSKLVEKDDKVSVVYETATLSVDEAKTNFVSAMDTRLAALLTPTNFMVIRENEALRQMPADIKAARKLAWTTLQELEIRILACTKLSELSKVKPDVYKFLSQTELIKSA